MPSKDQRGVATFFDVFRQEADVISERRAAVARGRLAADRGHSAEEQRAAADHASSRIVVEERVVETPGGPACVRDERGRPVPRPNMGHNLTGLALSGGGIRSASFCLGVLQGLDALREDSEPQLMDQIDYLSTVSGGGYIGVSLVSGTMQAQGKFPFASRLDREETLETQHLRDFSKFLAPRGGFDILVGLVAVFRGLLINAMIFLGIILAAAALTVWINPTVEDLAKPDLVPGGWSRNLFFWSMVVGTLFLLAQPIFIVVISRIRRPRLRLPARERWSRIFARMLVALALVAAIEGGRPTSSRAFSPRGRIRGQRTRPRRTRSAGSCGRWAS